MKPLKKSLDKKTNIIYPYESGGKKDEDTGYRLSGWVSWVKTCYADKGDMCYH